RALDEAVVGEFASNHSPNIRFAKEVELAEEHVTPRKQFDGVERGLIDAELARKTTHQGGGTCPRCTIDQCRDDHGADELLAQRCGKRRSELCGLDGREIIDGNIDLQKGLL